METAIFLIFAALALGSAITVVAHRNPVYATMSLVLTLFSVAVLFVLLGAPFLAALQILIYTGAIVVLFLFVVMLLNIGREEAGSGQTGQRWAALLGAAVFAGMLGMLFYRAYGEVPRTPLPESLVSMKGLARTLFAEYLLPFEIVGLLLLVAVVAGTVIARKPPAAPVGREGETAPAHVVSTGGAEP